MVMGEQPDLSDHNKSILEIVHKDANESLKICRDEINSLNTRLAVIIGFDASFVVFLSKIPSRSIFLLSGYTSRIGGNNSSIFVEMIMSFFTKIINDFFTLRFLIGLSLIVSLIAAINGLSPTNQRVLLDPVKMLDRSKNTTEKFLLMAIIKNRSSTISELENLINKKGGMLNLALKFLGIAAIIAILFIISDTSVTKWG